MTEELYEALLFMIDGRKMRRKSPKQYYQYFGPVHAKELNVMIEVKIDNLLITSFNQDYHKMQADQAKKTKAKGVK